MRARVKKLLFQVLAISYFVACFFTIFSYLGFKDALGSDFVSFLTGAKIVRQGKGHNLYDTNTQYEYQKQITYPHEDTSLLPYVNIPLYAVLFIPFTYTNLLLSYRLYISITLIILAGFSYLSLKVFEDFKGKYLPLALPFIFYPVFGSVFVAQNTAFFLVNLLLLYSFLKSNKFTIAGFLSGLFLLKTQYLVIFPFLFLISKNKKDFLKGFSLSALIILLPSFLIYGGNFFNNYTKFLFYVQQPGFGTRMQDMFSLLAGLSQIKLFASYSFSDFFKLNALFYLLSIVFFYMARRILSFDKLYLLSVIFMLIFSVHAIEYDFAFVLIPILILLNKYYRDLKENKFYLNETISVFILLFLCLFSLFESSVAAPFILIFSALFANFGELKKLKGFVFRK